MADIPKDIAGRLKAMTAAVKDLEALIKIVKKDAPPMLQTAALQACRKSRTAAASDRGEPLSAWLADLERNLAGPTADAQATFGAALEDGLKAAGLPLRGRWPEWMSGPFRIQARPERGEVVLDWGPGAEPLGTASLDADAVVQQIPKLAAELRARHDAEALPARLLTAWRMALAATGRTDGDVPLADLIALVALQAQGPRFHERPSRAGWTVPYDRVQLSYDLARLRGLEHDGLSLRLRVATRDQTRRKGPLWLPDDAAGNGTFFATARFERRRS